MSGFIPAKLPLWPGNKDTYSCPVCDGFQKIWNRTSTTIRGGNGFSTEPGHLMNISFNLITCPCCKGTGDTGKETVSINVLVIDDGTECSTTYKEARNEQQETSKKEPNNKRHPDDPTGNSGEGCPSSSASSCDPTDSCSPSAAGAETADD